MKPRLLFLSNLFPTAAEPYRGLDNATLLHALSAEFDIRVISPRPVLPWAGRDFAPRAEDAPLRPRWIASAYLPKVGGPVNHLLMAASVRRGFEEALREFRPEVLLSAWVYPDSCAALHLANGRSPLVAIAQGSDVHQYLRMAARRRAMLKYLPRAAAVITRSAALAGLLAEAGLHAGMLRTIYNGVRLDAFQPRDQAAARRECGLAGEGPVILFAGNFYPVKNPLLLVRAFAELDGSARLVMAGGGPLEAASVQLAGQLGVAPRVLLAGRKNPAEIARLMNCADMLVVPSENEGVPNVILEAFASGLPVVASDTGGIPEVLNQPVLGRLVPPGDPRALAAAIKEQLATPRDTAAIRRHGERYSWEAAAAGYRAILAEAMGAGGR